MYGACSTLVSDTLARAASLLGDMLPLVGFVSALSLAFSIAWFVKRYTSA